MPMSRAKQVRASRLRFKIMIFSPTEVNLEKIL
jgi:hypothetical protein